MGRATSLPRGPRARLEALLEHLLDTTHKVIAELDALDGDPDLEPNLGAPEDHPSLFRPYLRPTNPGDQSHWERGAQDDREEECEDEGAQCEDEGVSGLHDPDREPDHEWETCHWQDEGDQSTLLPHGVFVRGKSARPSVHQNVGAFIPVRAL